MSSRSKNLVGLDIEPHGITAAVAAVEHGGLVVRRAAYEPLEPGVVRDGEVVDAEALTLALQRLWKGADRGLPKRVRVGIANQKIVTRIIDFPPLSDAKELEAAVLFRAQDEIPMPLDAAVLDWHAMDVVDGPEGRRQRVLLVAARRDMVERVLGAVRAAGLRCEGIDLSAFALVRAMHDPAHDDGGHVLYLSIGGLTNLAVAEGTTCLFTRATGGGVEGLAVELAERRQITLDEARVVLRRTGVPRPQDAPEPVAAAPIEPVTLTWGDVPDPSARSEHVEQEPTEVAPLRFTGLSAADELFGGDHDPAPAPAPGGPPAAPPATTVMAAPALGVSAGLRPEDDEDVVSEAREILLEGVRRIAAEVRTSMDFHGAQGADSRVKRVLLTGPAIAVPGFADALGEHLKLDVHPIVLPGTPPEAPDAAVAAGLAVSEAPR